MFEIDEHRYSRCDDIKYFCNCNRLLSGRNFRQHSEMKTRQRWCLAIFLVAALLVLLVFFSGGFSGRKRLEINLDELTERTKCPACYGVNLCPAMLSGKIELSDWTKYSVMKLVNSKNIFYADWTERGVTKKVILKKLGHDHELDKLDRTICDRNNKAHHCDVSDAVRYLIDEYSKTVEMDPDKRILHGEKIGSGSDVLLCPTNEKMQYLVDAVLKFNAGQHRNTIMANVLTMLLLNSEPLLLQAFPMEQNWPFPKYYGACGRIVVEEYVGRRLTTYYNEPFKTRAILAKQLLRMANLFSDNPANEQFILYMTDVSGDNFAVNENSLEVKLIDLENVLVVDKDDLIARKGKDEDVMFMSSSVNCSNTDPTECFATDLESICTRRRADHNYYAVCAGLLAPGALAPEFPNGLLHTIPQGEPALVHLEQLLLQCKNPRTGNLPHLDRLQATQNMLKLLEDYTWGHP